MTTGPVAGWRSALSETDFLAVAAGRPVYTVTMRKRVEQDLRTYPGDRHPSAKVHGIGARELHEKLAPVLDRISSPLRDPRAAPVLQGAP